MPKKTKKEEDGDIKRFKAFVTTVLGKKGAEVFAQNNAIWEEKIEKDEPELENFILKAIEFDNAACAVILMDDWMNRMNSSKNYEKWTKNTPQIKKLILDDVYFQIKTDVFRTSMEKFGGRKGITDIMFKSSDEAKKGNLARVSELTKPLVEMLHDNPFVSNVFFHYVSISEEMEWFIYLHYKEPSRILTRNVNFICPIEHILLRSGFNAFERKDYFEAEKYFLEAKKWNPFSVNGLRGLSLAYRNQKKWNELLITVKECFKYAYRPSHFKSLYNLLIDYFAEKDKDKDALCCNYLKMFYVESDSDRKKVARDIQFLHRIEKYENGIKRTTGKLCDDYLYNTVDILREKKNKRNSLQGKSTITMKDVQKSSQKYGYPMGVNPEIVEIAKTLFQKASQSGKTKNAEYFKGILDDLEKCSEKMKDLQKIGSHRRIHRTLN